MIRFAIFKKVAETAEGQKVVLEYDENQILSRLQARMREKMSETETITVITHRWPRKDEVIIKNTWDKDEVAKFLGQAFPGLIAEFKEKTVSLA